MANYAVLKAAINAVIKTNGNKEITGQVLNQTLMAIVDSLGENYQFAGVAVPSTNPGTPDQNIFYLATQAGTYTNFGATVLPAGISMLEWKNNTWSSETFFTIDDAPTAGSDHLVKSGGVKTAIDNVAFSTNEKVKDVGIDSTPTSGSDNLIKSGAVFDAFKNDGGAYDVSVHFPTGGVEGGNTYTLDGAIAMVPQNMQKGGMSIKFVSSSDNKYIQARCMAQNFTTDTTQWQGVDDNPTAESKNLVESGGVASKNKELNNKIETGHIYITVLSGYTYNDNLGKMVNYGGDYRATQKIPILQRYETNIFSKHGYEALFWRDGVYLGYSQTTIDKPTTWKVEDHTLTPTHIAFCWTTSDILLYYTDALYDIIQAIKLSDKNKLPLWIDKTDIDNNGNRIYSNNYISTQRISVKKDDIITSDKILYSVYLYNGSAYMGDYAVLDTTYTIPEHVTSVVFIVSITLGNPEWLKINGYDLQYYIIDELTNTIPTKTSELYNDSNYINQTKTINGQSIVGQGDIEITSVESLKTINGQSIVGSGNIVITGGDSTSFINAYDFGFLSSATATENTAALQNALNGGNKTVVITIPGIYLLNDTILLDDNTELVCAKGVVLKKDANYNNVFRNRGAETRTYNSNITLSGINIDVNGKSGPMNIDDALYGARGEICFVAVKNLSIFDYSCLNLGSVNYGILVNMAYNVIIDRFTIKGEKDGVHISAIDKFVIKNGICQTYDDALAFNACDWPSSNCVCGSITNGIVENITDEYLSPTTGLTCRLLVGAWVDWTQGMEIHRGDTVICNGNVYRAITLSTTDSLFTSSTEPTIQTYNGKQEDSGGFYWKLMLKNEVYYSSDIINISFNQLVCKSQRVGIGEQIDGTESIYNRSLHPLVNISDYPHINISLEDCSFIESSAVYRSNKDANSYVKFIGGRAYSGIGLCYEQTISNGIIKRIDLCNVDFTYGSPYVRGGNNTLVKFNDCLLKDSTDMNIISEGRVISDFNLMGYPQNPRIGDSIYYGNVPYIYVNAVTGWKSLISSQ